MSARRHQPVRLLDEGRILSKSECDALAQRIFNLARGGGETIVTILSWANGELRWARNRVSLAGDRRDIVLTIERKVPSVGSGRATTNQLDDASLDAAVRAAELGVEVAMRPASQQLAGVPPLPTAEWPTPTIWSDATDRVTPETRGEMARALIDPAEAKGFLSAGYVEMRAGARMKVSSVRPAGPYTPFDIPYARWTQAQCSMTVRDPQGAGSGWAGLSSYDWAKIDAPALAARALEKCEASRNPVALEPGRYTVILEPQAVADLTEIVANHMIRLQDGEGNPGAVWSLAFDNALQIWRTKLGLKVLDERITISHDPMDPALGILPEPWMQPVTWFDKGVLTALAYTRTYALAALNANAELRSMIGYRMSGGTTSVEEMIASTKRGLLVTRFSNIRELDATSLLSTGLTRDGLWLIENGKISKAVKNLRFTESPLFALNAIEQLGVPAPVFRPVRDPYDVLPLTPAIVPALKVRDFSFTSTSDAI